MVSLSILSYFIATSPKKSRKRRRRPKNKPAQDEPQFYTALPSTVGLTDIPEEFSKEPSNEEKVYETFCGT